jgi:hypothetical protein
MITLIGSKGPGPVLTHYQYTYYGHAHEQSVLHCRYAHCCLRDLEALSLELVQLLEEERKDLVNSRRHHDAVTEGLRKARPFSATCPVRHAVSTIEKSSTFSLPA